MDSLCQSVSSASKPTVVMRMALVITPTAVSANGRGSGGAGLVGLGHPLGRRRILGQHRGRPDRPCDEVAAAVGTGPHEPLLSTVLAECAFEGADPRLDRVGRQVAIAAFAVGFEDQHGELRTRLAE